MVQAHSLIIRAARSAQRAAMTAALVLAAGSLLPQQVLAASDGASYDLEIGGMT